jgi:hypothetical protein
MEDEQNLDDSIDSVIIGGGQILNDQISDDNILEEEDECESRIGEFQHQADDLSIGIQCGVSNRVEDCCRLHALRVGHP